MDSMLPKLFPVPKDVLRSDSVRVNNVLKGLVNRRMAT